MLIKMHTQLTDAELEEQFANFTLKPRLFSPEAHLRLAYLHISKYGVEQAIQNMCEQIKGYANSLGATMKFNLTVTIVSVRLLHDYMSKSSSTSFVALIDENPEIIKDFKGVIGRHYSYNVFGDKQAKQEFVAPDLAPLP